MTPAELTMDRGKLIERLNARLAEIGGCGNAVCVVVRPQGMATNGGCRCLANSFTAGRVVSAYKAALKDALSKPPPRPTREEVARVIDPLAMDAGWDPERGSVQNDIDADQKAALAKADEILSLFSGGGA